jgi:cell wall-associated NlpC family hydrolase
MELKTNNPLRPVVEYMNALEVANETQAAVIVALNARLDQAEAQEGRLLADIDSLERYQPAAAVIAAAFMLKWLDIPYVFGGDWDDRNPEKHRAFDCSSFVQAAYDSQGYKLPRVSRDQAKEGRAVAEGDILPGDLIFFDTSGNGVINHVGISLGLYNMIHTAKPGENINVTNWRERYGNLAAARRII